MSPTPVQSVHEIGSRSVASPEITERSKISLADELNSSTKNIFSMILKKKVRLIFFFILSSYLIIIFEVEKNELSIFYEKNNTKHP